jgi:N-acyl-L-homoserine lactone synthetase
VIREEALIQVIDQTNTHLHSETLRSFAALRYQVFVKQLGWQLPCEEPGFEHDQFDDGAAVYLVLTDCNGHAMGGARLLDTSRRSLLAEVFPYLVDGSPPTDPKVFEVTRFVATSPNGERIDCTELLWALQVYGVWAGLTHFVSVSYLSLEPILRRSGYRFRRLGRAMPMDGSRVAALQHDIDAATRERLRHRLGPRAVFSGFLRPPSGRARATDT